MPVYNHELKKAMGLLASDPRTIFVGQSVGVPGTNMHASLADIDPARRIEFPVAEELQLGYCTGLALQGFLPVSIFPRWNFLLLAANQLVNHLDRLPLFSGYCPKVIIRTAVGASQPLNPGPQHSDDFSYAFGQMLRTVDIVKVWKACEIVPAYEAALKSDLSTIIVEHGSRYNPAS